MLSNKSQNKLKIFLSILIIVVSIFVIQKNQSDNRDLPKARPDDFGFCLNFNTFGRDQIDTYNETFTKDLVMGRTKTISFKLPDDVKDEIYSLMMDMKILSYPETLTTSGMSAIPPCDYKLKVTIEGKTKTIIWDGGLYPSNTDDIPQKYADFLKLVEFISSYIHSTDEYKGMPPVEGGYE